MATKHPLGVFPFNIGHIDLRICVNDGAAFKRSKLGNGYAHKDVRCKYFVLVDKTRCENFVCQLVAEESIGMCP